MVNHSRISAIWLAWAPQAGLSNASVTAGSGETLFKSEDYAVHLRDSDEGWAIDTLDDRGQKHDNVAKFSSFELAEKYLIWEWATLARSNLASGPLGTDLYKLGYASGIEADDLNQGNVKLRSRLDWAILVVGDATIFSHIMTKTVDQLLSIAETAGLQSAPSIEQN